MIVSFKEVRNLPEIFEVKLLTKEQLEIVLEWQPWIISGHTMQLLHWYDFNKLDDTKFNK